MYATISKRTSITCRIRRVVRQLLGHLTHCLLFAPLRLIYLRTLFLLLFPAPVHCSFGCFCCLRFLISFSFKCFRFSSKAVYYDALCFCCASTLVVVVVAAARCPRKVHEIKLNPQFIILCFFILFQFVARLAYTYSLAIPCPEFISKESRE